MNVISTHSNFMKAKDINIGGVIFHIEENGYFTLRNYLNQKPYCVEERLVELLLSLLDETKAFLEEEDIMMAIDSLENDRSICTESQTENYLSTYVLEIFYRQLGVSKTYLY